MRITRVASIAGNAMKIGGSADLRAALNLSSSSQASDTTDISALFDQLLAQNVSAQAGDPPPQENAAASPNENLAEADKATPYSASQQNFMQALLSASQSSDTPANSNARPIPVQPGTAGFPRIAALVTDTGPAWPPKAGAPEASAVQTGKIIDTKQTVSVKAPVQPAVSPTKTIAEILQSALAVPAPARTAPPLAPAAAPVPAQPTAQSTAAPTRVGKPDVVMDAKSFARLAQFIMPTGTKQALMTGAVPPTLPDANSAVAVNTNVVAKTTAPLPPEIAEQSQSSARPQITAASVIENAARPDVTDSPKLAILSQPSTLFASAATAKNVSVAAPSVAAPAKQSQTPIATSAQTRAATQSAPTLPVTVSDAIEGLRAALLSETESVAPTAAILAPKSSATAPVAVASSPQPQIPVQTVSPKLPDATAAPAQQTIRFIAGIDAKPVAQITQPSRFAAVLDAKNIAIPAQSGATLSEAIAKSPVPTTATTVQLSAAIPTTSIVDSKQTIAAQPTARFAAVIDTKNVAAPTLSTPSTVSEKSLQAAIASSTSNVRPVISSLIQKEPVADASGDAMPSADMTPSFAQTRNALPENSAQQDPAIKLTILAQPAPRLADIVETKNSTSATQSAPQTVSVKPQQVSEVPTLQNVKPAISPLVTTQPSIGAKFVPHETQADDPSPAAKIPAESAQTRDVKQDTSEHTATPRDTASDPKPETQIQPAPQPVADASAIVQPLIAPPVAVAPQPSKPAPKTETSVAARGSLAAAFAAAAAAKSVPPLATLPEETHTAPVAVSGKETWNTKDADQPDKNTDGPAQIAPVKTDPAAQAPVTLDTTTQSQPIDNTIQLPQTAIVLTNNSGAAAVQAPHASSNIDVSLQVGPKDHAPSAREPQVDLTALAINIAARSQGGSKHFDIRLDPAEMGRVEVRLSIDEGGKATAHLSAEKPQTLELLQRDSTTLERTLKDSGLDLSQNGLNFSLKGQNQQHNGSDARPQSTPLVVTATASPEPSLNPINMRADNVRLDIHV